MNTENVILVIDHGPTGLAGESHRSIHQRLAAFADPVVPVTRAQRRRAEREANRKTASAVLTGNRRQRRTEARSIADE